MNAEFQIRQRKGLKALAIALAIWAVAPAYVFLAQGQEAGPYYPNGSGYVQTSQIPATFPANSPLVNGFGLTSFQPTNNYGAPYVFASWYLGPNWTYIFCGTNGNDTTAVTSNSLYFSTLYDFTQSNSFTAPNNIWGGHMGAMSRATNPFTEVVLLSDMTAPAVPAFAANVILDLNGYTLRRVTNSASTNSWYPTIMNGQNHPFAQPFFYPNQNFMVENGRSYEHAEPYGQSFTTNGADMPNTAVLVGYDARYAMTRFAEK